MRPSDMRSIKVWLCILLIAALLGASCLSANALGWLRGDADGDGEITSVDVTVIQRVLVGIYTDGDGMISMRAAFTGGRLSLLDATELQRYLAQFPDQYAVGEYCTELPADFELPTQENQLPIIKV